jgi:hypothetical protein
LLHEVPQSELFPAFVEQDQSSDFMMEIPSAKLVLIVVVEERSCGSLSRILLAAILLHKIDNMFQSVNFVYRLIVNIFPLANETAVGGLQFSAEVELMQDKFDTAFDIGDDAAASFEKFDIVVVYIVVFFKVFFDADV